MEEEIIKPEKTESPKSTDRASKTETISSGEQNKNYAQALESNPDQFPSIANLRIPNADQIEPFQIVDGDKQIAASRKTEQVGSKTFHDGLKALGPDASDEDKAQYQIDYMNRKAEAECKSSSMLFKLNAEYTDIQVTPGIQSIDDATRFLGALANALEHGVIDTILHLSERNAINNDILASIAFLAQDNSVFNKQLIAAGEAILEKLDKPMKPEETANGAFQAAWFIVGKKKPIAETKILEQTGLTGSELRLLDAETRWTKYGVDWAERYRDFYFENRPHLAPIKKQFQVHHRIPQQVLEEYPGMFKPSEINDLSNLRAIKLNTVHGEISQRWFEFFNAGPRSKEDILNFAARIDHDFKGHLIE